VLPFFYLDMLLSREMKKRDRAGAWPLFTLRSGQNGAHRRPFLAHDIIIIIIIIDIDISRRTASIAK